MHVAKKPKVSEDDELEEGEIRSEEEDGSTEDDDGVNDDTEKKIPVMHHEDDEEDDSDEEELQGNQNLEVEMKDCPPHSSVQDAQVDDGNQNKEVSVNITSKTEEMMMVSQGPEEADNTETFTDDGRSLCEDDKFDVSPHECQKNINSNAGLPEDDGVQEKNGNNGANHDKEGQTDSCIASSQKDCPPHNSVQDAQVDDGNQNKEVSVNITSKTEEMMMVSQGPEEADNTETFTDDGRSLCEDDKFDVSPHECQKNINSNAGLPEDYGVQEKNGDNGANHDKEGQTDSCIASSQKDCPPHSSVQDAQVDDGNQNKEVSVNITSKTEEIMVSQGPEEADNTETFTDDGRSLCEDDKFDVSPHECQKNINSNAGLPEDDGVQEKNGDNGANHDKDRQTDSCIASSQKDCPPHTSVQDAQVDDGNQNKEVSVNITSKTEEMMMVSQDPEDADNTETFTDDGRSLCEDDKFDVSPHECQKNINSNAGLPEDHGVQEKNGDNGANHDKEGQTDSCIANSQSSPCEQSETNQIEGHENMHGDSIDVYSSVSENQANM